MVELVILSVYVGTERKKQVKGVMMEIRSQEMDADLTARYKLVLHVLMMVSHVFQSLSVAIQ